MDAVVLCMNVIGTVCNIYKAKRGIVRVFCMHAVFSGFDGDSGSGQAYAIVGIKAVIRCGDGIGAAGEYKVVFTGNAVSGRGSDCQGTTSV